jgi:hypothetical protein
MRTLLLVTMAVLLTACSMSADTENGFFYAPGNYMIYNCRDLANAYTVNIARQKELEELMAKAGSALDGRIVSAVTYQPEYLHVHSALIELRKVAAEKGCKPMPGVQAPVGPTIGNLY